ncbi:hypothetical protein CMI41_03590 [Candidatus Pacearchaeota archaeon]|nr:hypothetical protein [Candidatus Pacearchaeota archaeon]|tara:strand:+ start:2071 stop:3267 length:1197 start_codon:yes stop_codon:yes gene_type:complete
MVKMKRTNFVVPFIAVLTLLLVNFAVAFASVDSVEFNGVELDGITMAGMVDDTVPVKVIFTANEDAADVNLEVEMYGFRDDVSADADIDDIEDGVTYVKTLSLSLPDDADDLSEEYTLYVRMTTKTDIVTETYTVSLQRESHTLEILSVDFDSSVSAGESVPVTVVVKNTGYNQEDDVYVTVTIPELDVSERAYVGDLAPVECCDDGCDSDEDSESKTVYVKIPADADSDTYSIEVKAYSDDAETTESDTISVGGSTDSNFFPAAESKTLKAGETVSYDLVIVNTADNVATYELYEVSSEDLTVTVPSIVVVGPRDSEVVTIEVTADSDARGVYTFSVISDDKQVVYTADVSGSKVSSAIIALTIALVIIFLVLLVVLIVLATRKGSKEAEEVETSYY